MDSARKTLLYGFLLCAAAFSLQVIPRWWGDSIIMDEEWNLTASYYYWTRGDVMTGGGTTAPGALCAVPLLFMDLKLNPSIGQDWRPRALSLLFMDNLSHLEAITLWSRSVDWLIGLLIGFLLYRAVRDGPLALGLSALVLWAFEPTLLAFSGTAKTDVSVVFWFFLCVLYFKKIQQQEKILPFALAGCLAGLAASTRYNGLLVLPVLLAMEIFHGLGSGGGFKAFKRRFPLWLSGLVGFLAVVCLLYLPGTFVSRKHYWPITVFILNMSGYTGQRPEISNQFVCFANHTWQNGTYLLFPFHFFFKNTLPFFLLLTAGALLGLVKKGFLAPWVWVPPAVYLGLFWLFDKGMNIRHGLPAYPFLILIAARAFQWLWAQCGGSFRTLLRAALVCLLLWHVVGVIRNFPHHIAYANELIGIKDKPNLLYTFNWNLGQDMKRLALTARDRGWKRAKLMTAQRTDPFFYGMLWEPWTEKDLTQPQPGMVYVMDPSILFDHPVYRDLFLAHCPWLSQTPITGILGGTLYYFETPGILDPAYKDDSMAVNTFPYYTNGVPPYVSHSPPDTWIAR